MRGAWETGRARSAFSSGASYCRRDSNALNNNLSNRIFNSRSSRLSPNSFRGGPPTRSIPASLLTISSPYPALPDAHNVPASGWLRTIEIGPEVGFGPAVLGGLGNGHEEAELLPSSRSAGASWWRWPATSARSGGSDCGRCRRSGRCRADASRFRRGARRRS